MDGRFWLASALREAAGFHFWGCWDRNNLTVIHCTNIRRVDGLEVQSPELRRSEAGSGEGLQAAANRGSGAFQLISPA